MNLPKLLTYETEEEYKQHYIEHYCNPSPIMTFDEIPVMFYPERYEHAFYKRTKKSWKAKKLKNHWLSGSVVEAFAHPKL